MDGLREILRRYWGYESFRPLQTEAMQAVVNRRDSVVVLPTGGGKSLCFQAPALQLPGMAVIVSPLISLMKDQVDALKSCGVPAAMVNSTLSIEERKRVAADVLDGKIKLLYLSPERLMTERTLNFLKQTEVSFLAVDEAHCISEWGHDFRPEYRMLRRIKESFRGIHVHAYTATATKQVRDDIARELHLEQPEILVGSFDRPNLLYRVARRTDLVTQVRQVIDKHPGESGIIYCIRRRDVDELCGVLRTHGYKALPYHAGMSDEDRRTNQEAFATDKASIIVATVAFGMGIDKSDVRFVVHAAAPKSVEAYQQESGRAGRDGLEAECCLLYSDADFRTWRRLQADLPGHAYEIAMTVLQGIERYCQDTGCRHRRLVNYFSQEYPEEPCNACDVCLAELDLVSGALTIGQKVLSCVVRLNQGFGADYTAQVLTGSNDQRILQRGHDQLSTWGILKDNTKRDVRSWIEQLVGQGALEKVGDYSVLQVTEQGRRILRGEVTPKLLQPSGHGDRKSKAASVSWEGVDRGLFEELRRHRLQWAEDQGVPPFVVFSDATLRDLARRRPTTGEGLLEVHGIGEKKAARHGAELLTIIGAYCEEHDLGQDAVAPSGTAGA